MARIVMAVDRLTIGFSGPAAWAARVGDRPVSDRIAVPWLLRTPAAAKTKIDGGRLIAILVANGKSHVARN